MTSSGQRWGEVTLYACNSYPWGALAPVTYFWKPATESADVRNNCRQGVLWIWSHPASYEIVLSIPACWLEAFRLAERGAGPSLLGNGGFMTPKSNRTQNLLRGLKWVTADVRVTWLLIENHENLPYPASYGFIQVTRLAIHREFASPNRPNCIGSYILMWY